MTVHLIFTIKTESIIPKTYCAIQGSYYYLLKIVKLRLDDYVNNG